MKAKGLIVPANFVFAALTQAYRVSSNADQDTRCEVLHTDTVQFSSNHCLGDKIQGGSLCWTTVSFDLPQELSVDDAHVTNEPVKISPEGIVRNAEVGLTVVHGQGPAAKEIDENGVSSLDNSLSEELHNGKHYAIATRVVEEHPGRRTLQVHLRYGDTIGDLSNNVPDPVSVPVWFLSRSSQQIHRGGLDIKLDVVLCSPAAGHHAEGRLRSPTTDLQHRPGIVARRLLTDEKSEPLQGGQTLPTEDRADMIPTTTSRRKMIDPLPSQRGASSFQAVALRGGFNELALESFGTDQAQVKGEADLQADERSCDPYDGGDEWCAEAISSAEQRALQIQKTDMYCSRECDDHGALWCNIFGKTNCRMCSRNCAEFCSGKSNCRCHPCPESGASETWKCTVGRPLACYDQIFESDYKSLMISRQRLQCTWTCLREGGLWCEAMGIQGCRFCSLDCEGYCASNGAVFGEDCSCVQCPDNLEDPVFPSTREESTTCADVDDGDAFCREQVAEKAWTELGSQGMDVECHDECLPGMPWPVWCFAEETVGCRYCRDNCDDLCGEGVLECNSCYTCKENLSDDGGASQ